MTPLEPLQRAIAAGIVTGTSAAAISAIEPTAISPARRLGIYRNHYLITLSDALASNFPTVRTLVGPGFFGQVARRFATAVPPMGPCLHEYGGRFPGFLAQLSEAQDLPYLPDVARLDWALNFAYHAADELPLPLATLASLTPDVLARLRFKLHPAFQLVTSRFPLTAIWQAARQSELSDAVVDLNQGGEMLLILRDGDDVAFQRLDAGSHAFLTALMQRNTVIAAARQAREAMPGFDPALALQMLLDLDALTNCF